MSLCGSDAKQAKPHPSHQSPIQRQLGLSVRVDTKVMHLHPGLLQTWVSASLTFCLVHYANRLANPK